MRIHFHTSFKPILRHLTLTERPRVDIFDMFHLMWLLLWCVICVDSQHIHHQAYSFHGLKKCKRINLSHVQCDMLMNSYETTIKVCLRENKTFFLLKGLFTITDLVTNDSS